MIVGFMRDGEYTNVTVGERKLSIKDDENPIYAIKRVLEAMSEQLTEKRKAQENVCKECNGDGIVEDYADSAGYGGAPAFVTCPSCDGKKNPQRA